MDITITCDVLSYFSLTMAFVNWISHFGFSEDTKIISAVGNAVITSSDHCFTKCLYGAHITIRADSFFTNFFAAKIAVHVFPVPVAMTKKPR